MCCKPVAASQHWQSFVVAGVFEQQKRLSQDGYEMTWAVNVLAPFLLTAELLSTVTERIVNVSSISAASHIDFDNLQQVGVTAVKFMVL